jgi:hypothetical protein
MRKKNRKIRLQRETLYMLSDENRRMVMGGIATRLCTDTEECTQSLCGGYHPTYFCATDNTANTCAQVFSCGSCILVTCSC